MGVVDCQLLRPYHSVGIHNRRRIREVACQQGDGTLTKGIVAIGKGIDPCGEAIYVQVECIALNDNRNDILLSQPFMDCRIDRSLCQSISPDRFPVLEKTEIIRSISAHHYSIEVVGVNFSENHTTTVATLNSHVHLKRKVAIVRG